MLGVLSALAAEGWDRKRATKHRMNKPPVLAYRLAESNYGRQASKIPPTSISANT